MRIGLACTTIHIPHALKLLRKCGEEVRFFVAGDKKTPALEVVRMLDDNSYYSAGDGFSLWKCSEAIGFNTLARRNIAFLEALKWGADVIVSWDTDNYPLDTDYFNCFEDIFALPFCGIKATGGSGWLDPGKYLSPPTRHRGFPIQRRHTPVYTPVVDAKVGVATGLVLNDPDVDAIHRIEHAPASQQVSLLVEAGFVVDPHTWLVYNTQNTATVRELIPAWFLAPGVGRMDDIFGSMVVQRVARERNYHVHIGQPFVVQQRHEHDLIKDMRTEIDGYENVVKFAELLDSIILVGKNTIDDTRTIYNTLEHCEWYPKQAVKAALAYLDDCESIL